MNDWVIRPPTHRDGEAVGRLHARVWKHAYAGLMDADLLRDLDEGARVHRWQTTADQLDEFGVDGAGRRVAVAFVAERPIGLIETAPATEAESAWPTELLSLNIHPDWYGAGVAQALVAATLADADAYLWVLTGNERAIAFYRKLGFELDGEERYDDHWKCTDLRMVRPLVAAPT